MGSKTILLLGGTGTLSTAVLNEALKQCFKVCIMNRGYNNSSVPIEVEQIICDFYNVAEMISIFSDRSFDVIVDFLSRVPSDIERVFPIFKNKCKQYIFISSACVYRRANDDFPIKENSPKPNIDWKYNIDKYECELKLQELTNNSSVYYTIIRPYITYDDKRIPFGIAPMYKYHRTIIERFKAGKPWFVWDEGIALTTITNTKDFAVGVVGLFLNNKAKNEDFHITGDYFYTHLDLVKLLYNKLNIPCNIVSFTTNELIDFLPEYADMLRGDRSLNAIFDNSKIKEAVQGLQFYVDIDKGFDMIIKHWLENEPMYDYMFEARIDRLFSKKSIKLSYKQYPGANVKTWITYMLYRYLPLRLADKINRCICPKN